MFFNAGYMETAERKGERVRRSTSSAKNKEIDQEIMQNIRRFGTQGSATIQQRIRDLDKKWDIERTLEINAAVVALAGTLLATFVNKKWLILPVIVTTFLAQHAIQGWCPPLPLFRKLGIKSRPELDREKYALKAMRGDFQNVDGADEAWMAVKR